jgi:NAD-dependent dihydropyrimidine dehydrogenase PreA subunit
MAWIKVKVHGGRQAFAVNAEACQACGLCVTACPEHAIRLLATDRERTAP